MSTLDMQLTPGIEAVARKRGWEGRARFEEKTNMFALVLDMICNGCVILHVNKPADVAANINAPLYKQHHCEMAKWICDHHSPPVIHNAYMTWIRSHHKYPIMIGFYSHKWGGLWFHVLFANHFKEEYLKPGIMIPFFVAYETPLRDLQNKVFDGFLIRHKRLGSRL